MTILSRQAFDFDLPDALIARYPSKNRSDCRLMFVNGEEETIEHQCFKDILTFIQPGDVLILNNTKVLPARLFGQKITGGKVELLLERILDQHRALVHLFANKTPVVGSQIIFDETLKATIESRQDDLYVVVFEHEQKDLYAVFEQQGLIPLPPYIQRAAEDSDRERYQTVYATHAGAIAAPTAGLHFDNALLDTLQAKGVKIAYVTLHVGAGTFQSVRTDNILAHKMHSERFEVPQTTAELVNAAHATGHRVIAVGTTSIRCLESASDEQGQLHAFQGETDIFIYPGYQWRCVDVLITNFHIPESTLMMLVSAFAGYELIKTAYRLAIDEKYHFYSYGDAMLLSRRRQADPALID